MVVGAYYATVGTNSGQGAAYVFTESGSVWTQIAKLTASDGAPDDYFGNSVSISGNTVVVGAAGATVGNNSDQGAAYVFTESGSAWTQTAKLTASDGAASDYFGNSVSISGNTVVVGADNATVGANSAQGAAYVFTESGSAWTQAAKLTASDGAAHDYFGNSVSISGNTVVVGADGVTTAQGRPMSSRSPAPLGPRPPSSPRPMARLTNFGNSVSISGNTVVVGACHRHGRRQQRPGGGLCLHGVRLRLDPDRQAHRARWRGGRLFRQLGFDQRQHGRRRSSVAPRWRQQRPGGGLCVHGVRLRLDPDRQAHRARCAASDDFGSSISISGNTMVIGADNATVGTNGYQQGAAYVGPWPVASVTCVSPASGPAAGGTTVTITGTGFTGATLVDFGTTAARNVVINSATQITATSPAGTGTVNVTVVTPAGTSGPVTADEFLYVAAPTVTGLSASVGPLGGGTTVTIAGTSLANATAVMFGSTTGAIVSDTATQIVVVSPAENAGIVDVTVRTAGGTSAKSAADSFVYTPLAITSSNSTTFTVGTAGSFSVTAGNPAPTFTESGSLPSGVTFTSAGARAARQRPGLLASTP